MGESSPVWVYRGDAHRLDPADRAPLDVDPGGPQLGGDPGHPGGRRSATSALMSSTASPDSLDVGLV